MGEADTEQRADGAEGPTEVMRIQNPEPPQNHYAVF